MSTRVGIEKAPAEAAPPATDTDSSTAGDSSHAGVANLLAKKPSQDGAAAAPNPFAARKSWKKAGTFIVAVNRMKPKEVVAAFATWEAPPPPPPPMKTRASTPNAPGMHYRGSQQSTVGFVNNPDY